MKLNGDWEPAEPGVKRRLVALGNNLMAMRVRFEPGAVGARHAHPHEQLAIVVSGRFRFWLGEQLLELGAGDTLSIAGNLVHGAEALEAGELLDVFSPIRQDLLG